ncbi:deoxyribonuclease-2-beta [Neosynchiropus ocellatus]
MCAHVCLCLWLVLMFLCRCRSHISCRNEAGEPVDWFVVYKLPRYQIGGVGSGVDYMYLDSSVGTWVMSQFMVNMSEGAVANTLNQLYKGDAYKSDSSVYALYNDSPPDTVYIPGYGHTKGVLLFDHIQGFWMSHSIPHFPSAPEKGYVYPATGMYYGQTALCVTYKFDQFLHVEQQMTFLYPHFYNCSVPPAFSSRFPQLVEMCGGGRPLRSGDRRVWPLVSAGGQMFFSFVKSAKFVDDIYVGWVAQVLNSDLLVQSWQRQAKDLPSNCSLPKHAMNIKSIKLPGPVKFKSHEDHAKWCVSLTYKDQVTCLGDLNRQNVQMWRAGGVLCTDNPVIYKAFRPVVDWYISC